MAGEANIYLIGARACGKTTLGRRLAAKLKRPFVDTDQRVLLRTGKTVNFGQLTIPESEASSVYTLTATIVDSSGAFTSDQTQFEVLEPTIIPSPTVNPPLRWYNQWMRAVQPPRPKQPVIRSRGN